MVSIAWHVCPSSRSCDFARRKYVNPVRSATNTHQQNEKDPESTEDAVSFMAQGWLFQRNFLFFPIRVHGIDYLCCLCCSLPFSATYLDVCRCRRGFSTTRTCSGTSSSVTLRCSRCVLRKTARRSAGYRYKICPINVAVPTQVQSLCSLNVNERSSQDAMRYYSIAFCTFR